MKTAIKFAALLLLAGTCMAQAPQPQNGYVPDEKAAVKIAEAEVAQIYGEKQMQGERPFHGTLKDGVWTVSGTLPPNMVGGVAEIRIDQRTGAILSSVHYK